MWTWKKAHAADRNICFSVSYLMDLGLGSMIRIYGSMLYNNNYYIIIV